MPGIIWNLLQSLCDFVAGILGLLFATVIFAVGAVLEFAVDVLNWLLGVEDDIRQAGGTHVHVLDGSVFVEYIESQKAQGNTIEMTLDQAKQMRNSVVNVATDESGNVVRDPQMISGQSVSGPTKEQFNGRPVISIKI